MTLRLLAACALVTAVSLASPWTATAEPSQPEPGCPVTDPPVINRCGWDKPPDPVPPPPGVTVAQCVDGALDFTQQPNYRSTCSENGGVARWLLG
ncbi:hypothetical protein H7K45_17970 [Mycobacterium yunnanensis]|uniref:DUF3761 domain-containing protein n=1 Tax=Mycobacterium yunnanensis TaxID=368477 RepID=A0A9X3C368_9MYCO|nr:DUF3761 domain-containing protein [Mycobacterium yunnanensis]MCV7422436.1 hypothetical protein [Mycobacterium yunnanensis]